jgi:ketosteroid isomerase-like protein
MSFNTRRVGLLFISSILMFVLASCSSEPEPTMAVRAVIEAQQAAWNRGDIDGFMNGYEHSDTITFISGDQLTRGWQTVLERYKKRYSSPGLMGTLTFSDIEIQPLAPSYVLADGRWKLALNSESPHGRFTLIFRRAGNDWRIIHDTTTSAE